MDDALELEPFNPTGRQIMIKTIIGLIVGIFIAFLTFIILTLVTGIIQEALTNSLSGKISANPLLPLILMIIAFIATIVGMMLISGIFNLIYTDKYYDMGKMFSLTLLINVILFILFIPLYILFSSNTEALFFVLAFHIIFSVFASYTAMEMSTNPNYSAVHLIGTSIGLSTAIVFFGIGYSFIDINQGSSIKILLTLPPILAYFCLPLFHSIREKIYYKFYSMGNNFFYIPSLNEVMIDSEENDTVEVEIDN